VKAEFGLKIGAISKIAKAVTERIQRKIRGDSVGRTRKMRVTIQLATPRRGE
jgi:hypothetical protein